MKRAMDIVARGFFGLMALLFAYAAFLQLNDPDPAVWVAIYGAATLALIPAVLRRPLPRAVPATLATVSLAWALWLATIVFGDQPVHDMFPDQEKTGWVIVDAEEGREMGGLLIIAATMAALVAYRGPEPPSPLKGGQNRT